MQVDVVLLEFIKQFCGGSFHFRFRSLSQFVNSPMFVAAMQDINAGEDFVLLLKNLAESNSDPFGHILPKMFAEAIEYKNKETYAFLKAYLIARNILDKPEDFSVIIENHVLQAKFDVPERLFSKFPTPTEEDLEKFNAIPNLMVTLENTEVEIDTQIEGIPLIQHQQEVLDNSEPLLFKLALIGESGVGKTQFISRFVSDSFTDTFISTIGVEFNAVTRQIQGRNAKLQIWDLAGQERFRSVVQSYYQGTAALVLVYDISDRKSFDNLIENAPTVLQKQEKLAAILVGNKSDLEQRAVSYDLAKRWADEKGIPFLEASAKTGDNVEMVFQSVVKMAMDNL